MKIILSICILLTSAIPMLHAQSTVSGAIKPTPSVANGVTIFLNSSSTISGLVSGVSLPLAVPVTVGARPTITIDNSPNSSVVYTLQNTIDQTIQGSNYYVYNLLGTGDQGGSAITYTLNAGVEVPIVRVTFSNNSSSAQVRLVNLPDGGTDPNPNSYFAFSVQGDDKTNQASMFYSVPGVSIAQNEIIPGGYSGLSITSTNGLIVLPVKFTSFTAIKKDNDAQLNWIVANENSAVNNYQIERSIDGISFVKITNLPKNSNGNSTNTYTSYDRNVSAVKSNGVIYYRIKQIDFDGRFVYSETKTIRVSAKNSFISVYPNPVRAITTVEIESAEQQDISMNLISTDGKILQTITFKSNKGLNTRKINMNNYSSGSYLLKVNLGNDSQTIKIIKE